MKAKYVNERLGWAWRIPSACHASLPEAARRIVLFLLLIIHPCWIYMVLRLGHQQTKIRTLHNHLINVQGILLSLTGSKSAPNLRFKILSNTGPDMSGESGVPHGESSGGDSHGIPRVRSATSFSSKFPMTTHPRPYLNHVQPMFNEIMFWYFLK